MCYDISLLAIQSLGIHPSATCVRAILLLLIGETEKKKIDFAIQLELVTDF